MLHLRVLAPTEMTDEILECLEIDEAVSGLAVFRGAGVRPPGDLIMAQVAREGANDIVQRLRERKVHQHGSIELEGVDTWMSRKGFDAELRTPGSSSDAVVWAQVAQRAYEDSELNWTYLSFLTMATVIASIAIITDSEILVVGAMVLGPEFGAIAALGVALVRKRFVLLQLAIRTLVVGFLVAIAVTLVLTLAGRGLGWIALDDIVGARPNTAFIYTPDKWSFIVALIAGAAGVLSITSAKSIGLAGVFISVTTVPAAGNIALGVAFLNGSTIWGSVAQLFLNIAGMAIAGWLTLVVQERLWTRVSVRRARHLRVPRRML
ncbi:DUF389 domain-containing protein [Nocardia jejuensis]|uniref:DUF389 domain-containing protein n=1 Tax=Nocardia jejuensis TaxID=328049 RepID=UPI00083654DF|nr:DUF389 domain-containing protein [Nocardia jejuensis]